MSVDQEAVQVAQDAKQMLEEVAAHVRSLGDLKHEAAVDQARLLAPFWMDTPSLARLAEMLDASEQWLRKMSGAGKVQEMDSAPEAVGVEFLYQVSLFPQEEWEEVMDLALLCGGDAVFLRKVRQAIEAATEFGHHFCLVRGCEHGVGDVV